MSNAKTTIKARLQDEYLVIVNAPAISTGDKGAIEFQIDSVIDGSIYTYMPSQEAF